MSTGEEVWDSKAIAKNYVKGGRFWVDVISSIPLDKFATGKESSKYLAVFKLLKIIRVTRVSRII